MGPFRVHSIPLFLRDFVQRDNHISLAAGDDGSKILCFASFKIVETLGNLGGLQSETASSLNGAILPRAADCQLGDSPIATHRNKSRRVERQPRSTFGGDQFSSVLLGLLGQPIRLSHLRHLVPHRIALMLGDNSVVDNRPHRDNGHQTCDPGPEKRLLAIAALCLIVGTVLAYLASEKVEGSLLSFFSAVLGCGMLITGGFFLTKGVAEYCQEVGRAHVTPYVVSSFDTPFASRELPPPALAQGALAIARIASVPSAVAPGSLP